MKKRVKIILLCILIVFSQFLNVACSSNSLSGTYEVVDARWDNEFFTPVFNYYQVVFDFTSTAYALTAIVDYFSDDFFNAWENSIPRSSTTVISAIEDSYGNKRIKFVTEGKYSVTENEIELIGEDGEIYVLPFSQTENTFTLDGVRFNKR